MKKKLQILDKTQLLFLKKFTRESSLVNAFYLTGGTALAGFYLFHRYSEDLDFFSEHEVDLLTVNVFLAKAKKEMIMEKIDFQGTYNRNIFFLHGRNVELKVEFTYFPFPRIEKNNTRSGLPLDSIIDIAVNKLFTMYQRTQARDYIDLYCICKEQKLEIPELIKQAKAKFDWHIDPIQLGTQFVKAGHVMDLPKMIKKIPEKEWRNFFIEEAKKLKNEIIQTE